METWNSPRPPRGNSNANLTASSWGRPSGSRAHQGLPTTSAQRGLPTNALQPGLDMTVPPPNAAHDPRVLRSSCNAGRDPYGNNQWGSGPQWPPGPLSHAFMGQAPPRIPTGPPPRPPMGQPPRPPTGPPPRPPPRPSPIPPPGPPPMWGPPRGAAPDTTAVGGPIRRLRNRTESPIPQPTVGPFLFPVGPPPTGPPFLWPQFHIAPAHPPQWPMASNTLAPVGQPLQWPFGPNTQASGCTSPLASMGPTPLASTGPTPHGSGMSLTLAACQPDMTALVTSRDPRLRVKNPSASTTPKPSESTTSKPSGSATPKRYGSATPKRYGSATPKPSESTTSKPSGSATPKRSGSATPKPWERTTSKSSGSATPKRSRSDFPKSSGSPTPPPMKVPTPRRRARNTTPSMEGAATEAMDIPPRRLSSNSTPLGSGFPSPTWPEPRPVRALTLRSSRAMSDGPPLAPQKKRQYTKRCRSLSSSVEVPGGKDEDIDVLWRIPNFGHFYCCWINESIASVFHVSNKDLPAFRLVLYPNGHKSVGSDYVSLSVYGNHIKGKYFNCQLGLVDSEQKRVPFKSNIKRSGSTVFYFHKFLKRSVIEDDISRYLVDDTLTVFFRARLLKETSARLWLTSTSLPFYEDPREQEDRVYCSNYLSGLLGRDHGTDVCLVAGGMSFNVHKCVVASMSETLSKIFQDQPDVAKFDFNILPSSMEQMLKFIYGDKTFNMVGISAKEAMTLWEASTMMKVVQLPELLVSRLMRMDFVSQCLRKETEDVESVLKFAIDSDLILLRDKCLNAMKNCPEVKFKMNG